MKVGILGSGQVGQTLAQGFSSKGHDVMVGTRDPKAKGGLKLGKAKLGTFAEAARHGDILVLCVHGSNVAEAVSAAGAENMARKLVLDTSNPLGPGPGGMHKPANIPDSCLQVAQRAAPQANFVKAWNCTPGAQMVDPKFKEGVGDQFICGDDAKAKAQAATVLKEFGWNTADVGDASMAPYIEGMALAAINWAIKANDWTWGLKIVRG